MFTNLSIRCIAKNINGFGCRWISSTNSRLSNESIIDPPDRAPVIPSSYKQREGENITVMKARLLYQSRKRGMLENGLLLSTFAAKFLQDMNEKQLGLYDELINSPSNEWDLYYWASGLKPAPEKFQHEVMEMLKEHVQNSDKKCRVKQPNLW